MVERNVIQKVEKGQLQGFNLSELKVKFQNDLISFQRMLEEAIQIRDLDSVQQIKSRVERTQRCLDNISLAIEDLDHKKGNYLKIQEGDTVKYENIEKLEKQKEAEEWLKYQEYMRSHPNQKKQPFFMKMIRQDSSSTAIDKIRGKPFTEEEIAQNALKSELSLMKRRSQMNFEETKRETYYKLMQRKKKELASLHSAISLSFEKDIEVIEESEGKL